jgi:hypothetical protein
MNKDRGCQGDNIPRAEMKARLAGTVRLLQRDAIPRHAGLLSGERCNQPVPPVRHSMGLIYRHWKRWAR